MSLLSRIRRILGNERETPEHNDAPQETKVADRNIPTPAPKAETVKHTTEIAPGAIGRERWEVLNKPDFTRHSYRVVRVGRSRSGAPVLFEIDVRTGRRVDEDERSPFALEPPKK